MQTPARHRFFGLDSGERFDRNDELATRMERCLSRDIEQRCGLSSEALADAVDRELTRRFAGGAFVDLEAVGLDVAGKRVLDLGSGMGSGAVEAALRGAWPIAVEP